MKRKKQTSFILLVSCAIIFQFQNCGYFVELKPENATAQMSSLDLTNEGEDLEITVFINDRKNGLPQQFNYEITADDNYGDADDFVEMSGVVAVDQSISIEDMVKKGLQLKIPTQEDDIYEGPQEKFTLTISDPTGNFLPSDLVIPFFVAENDTVPTITIDPSSAAEADPLNFIIQLSHPSAFPIDVELVNFTPADVAGADMNDDYIVTETQFTFNPEQETIPFSITTMPDNRIERDETATFEIVGGEGSRANPDPVTFMISDNSALPMITLADVVFDENENIVLQASFAPQDSITDFAVTVNYDIDLNGRLNAADFAVAPVLTGSLTIPAGQQVSNVATLVIDDDAIDEVTETMTVNLVDPTGQFTDAGGIDLTVTLNDNDTAQISLVDIGNVNEDDNNVQVQVVSNLTMDRGISLMLNTMDGTATGNGNGRDFDQLNNVNININTPLVAMTPRTIDTVNLRSDNVFEGNETFMAMIANLNDPGADAVGDLPALITVATRTVTIVDAESAPVLMIQRLNNNDYNEGEQVRFRARTVGNVTSTAPIIINVNTTDITTTVNVDYTVPVAAVPLPAGSTQVDFAVNILDDGIMMEDDESFQVTVTSLNLAAAQNFSVVIDGDND